MSTLHRGTGTSFHVMSFTLGFTNARVRKPGYEARQV